MHCSKRWELLVFSGSSQLGGMKGPINAAFAWRHGLCSRCSDWGCPHFALGNHHVGSDDFCADPHFCPDAPIARRHQGYFSYGLASVSLACDLGNLNRCWPAQTQKLGANFNVGVFGVTRSDERVFWSNRVSPASFCTTELWPRSFRRDLHTDRNGLLLAIITGDRALVVNLFLAQTSKDAIFTIAICTCWRHSI